MKRKLMSCILAFSMMLTMLPTALAVENGATETQVVDAATETQVATLPTGEIALGSSDSRPVSAFQNVSIGTISEVDGVYNIPVSGTVNYVKDLPDTVTGGTAEFKQGHYMVLNFLKPDGLGQTYTRKFEGLRWPTDTSLTFWADQNLKNGYCTYFLDLRKVTDLTTGFSIVTSWTDDNGAHTVTYKVDTKGLTLAQPTQNAVAIPGADSVVDSVDVANLQSLTMGATSYTSTGLTSTYTAVLNGTVKYATVNPQGGHYIALKLAKPAELTGIWDGATVTVKDSSNQTVGNAWASSNSMMVLLFLDGITANNGKKLITYTVEWESELYRKNNAAGKDSVQYIIDVTNLTLEANPATLHKITAPTTLTANQIEFYTMSGTTRTPITDMTKVAENTTVYFQIKVGEDKIVGAPTATDADGGSVTVAEVDATEKIYSFTMPQKDVTIAATVKNAQHTVTIAPSVCGTIIVKDATGAIINSGEKVEDDAKLTITVVANKGYAVGTLKNGNNTVSANQGGSYTVTASDDVKLVATFTEVKKDITVSSVTGGVVTESTGAGSARVGSTVTLLVTPLEDYELVSITVTYNTDEKADVTVSDNKATFTMPAYDVTVAATFKKTVTDVKNGTTTTVTGTTANVTVKEDAVKGEIDEIVKDTSNTAPEISLDGTTSNGTNVNSANVKLGDEVVKTVTGAVEDNNNSISSATVTVKTDVGTVSINDKVLVTVKDQDASLTVKKDDASKVADEAEKAGAPAPIKGTKTVTVQLVDKKNEEIRIASAANNKITLTVNFGTTNLKNTKIYYISSDGKTHDEITKDKILKIEANGDVTFEVDHLTTFYLAKDLTVNDSRTLNVSVKEMTGMLAKYCVTISDASAVANDWITVQVMKLGGSIFDDVDIMYVQLDTNKTFIYYTAGNVKITVFDGMITNSTLLAECENFTDQTPVATQNAN